ncbi:putative outer membrane autotransporter barrel precursor [Pusillimonas sp. T7-7]|uniref:S8 family serine peptidase n=1 Tax=Pusillimonas sp. (strain T7-7) TaxID=1007105 RepID=UPI00020845A3|nr:S8 family serine peptidase [Pusillimonas sp. T7-7]AEC18661.1 putative outer membrane autotransporter barrel precursor [Pusillimonas sp. T7-7]
MPLDQTRTARYLVLLCPDQPQEGIKKLIEITGVSIAEASSSTDTTNISGELAPHCAIVFNKIGVALLRCDLGKQAMLDAAVSDSHSRILAVERERTVHALVRRQASIPRPVPNPVIAANATDESLSTWGIQAVGADKSGYSGKGVRLAILDTGIDLEHPDFAGRKMETRSFIDGQTVQDGNGHGTHCAGIACGPLKPEAAPRYGVAGDALLYAGKVLSDEGSGADGSVLEGINWAIENQCRVVSMSLGSPVEPGQGYSRVFEEVAQRALAAGTVIVAAAGNDSERPDHIAPVSHPANCPSIMAVAAVDQQMQIAPFSSGGLGGEGGQVDLAGPGVAVLSAWPGPEHYHTASGTSMATPFVAGVAALLVEADSAIAGQTLLERIVQSTRSLSLPARDVGAGLIQAS